MHGEHASINDAHIFETVHLESGIDNTFRTKSEWDITVDQEFPYLQALVMPLQRFQLGDGPSKVYELQVR